MSELFLFLAFFLGLIVGIMLLPTVFLIMVFKEED